MCQGDLPSTSVNFPWGWKTFRQFLSTFCVAWKPSMKFHQLSVHPGELPSTSVRQGDLLSTYVIFVCCWETFLQLSVWSGDLPSTSVSITEDLCTSVNFTYCWENFRRLPSNFLANGRPSVNFFHLSVWRGDLPLITEGFLAARKSDGR